MAHKGIVYKVNLTEVWLFNVLDRSYLYVGYGANIIESYDFIMSEWATMEPNMRKPHRGFVVYRAVLALHANAVCAEECGKATPSVLHLRAFRRRGSSLCSATLPFQERNPGGVCCLQRADSIAVSLFTGRYWRVTSALSWSE